MAPRITTLAKSEPTDLAPPSDTEERWALIQRTFAKDATPDEFALFRRVAEREGLDPFTREIHFIKRRAGDVSFVVGVHGLVGRLTKIESYRGIQSAAVCAGEVCTIDAAAGTVAHSFAAAKRGPVVGAWARGQIGVRLPVVRYVSIDEYRGQSPLWREKPGTMIEKVAIAQCARALAPRELAGLYAAEEFGGQSSPTGQVMLSTSPAPEDTDAVTIASALAAIEAVPDIEALDAALVSIRAEATGWTPNARRLFASHVARRREALTSPPAAEWGPSGPPEEEVQ